MKNFEEFIKENADSEESINKILDKKKKNLSDKDKIALKKYCKFKVLPKKPFNQKDINRFDKVTYVRKGSKYNGKTGIVLTIRKDGKYLVRFEDGSRLAASPIYLIKETITDAMKKVDPYNEEDWG